MHTTTAEKRLKAANDNYRRSIARGTVAEMNAALAELDAAFRAVHGAAATKAVQS